MASMHHKHGMVNTSLIQTLCCYLPRDRFKGTTITQSFRRSGSLCFCMFLWFWLSYFRVWPHFKYTPPCVSSRAEAQFRKEKQAVLQLTLIVMSFLFGYIPFTGKQSIDPLRKSWQQMSSPHFLQLTNSGQCRNTKTHEKTGKSTTISDSPNIFSSVYLNAWTQCSTTSAPPKWGHTRDYSLERYVVKVNPG